jgi:hypothetical protein
VTRDFGAWNMVFYSLVVIVIMRVYRDGIVALFRRIFLRFIGSPKRAAANLTPGGDQ